MAVSLSPVDDEADLGNANNGLLESCGELASFQSEIGSLYVLPFFFEYFFSF